MQTPSLLPPPLIHGILDALDKKYGISSSAEISMEADPGTFDRARVQQYTRMGINRISTGVQAFQEVSYERGGPGAAAHDRARHTHVPRWPRCSRFWSCAAGPTPWLTRTARSTSSAVAVVCSGA